jgi:putative transposase
MENCSRVLKTNQKKYCVKIQAFVLMNNHNHLVVRTPCKNLDKFMRQINTLISKRINSSFGRINHVFGERYQWSLVTEKYYYNSVIKYVYQNPLVRIYVIKLKIILIRLFIMSSLNLALLKLKRF